MSRIRRWLAGVFMRLSLALMAGVKPPKRRARGYIVYQDPDEDRPRVWCVDCCVPSDTSESLRKHLHRWQRSFHFIGAIIVPDDQEAG